MRQQTGVDDALLAQIGEGLLHESNACQLSYVRCNPFDVLPGMTSLSLAEASCLDAGALTLLGGVLRYNTVLRDLDLAGTNITDSTGAEQLASALSLNAGLTSLNLQNNPLAPNGKARVAFDAIVSDKRPAALPLAITM